MSKREYIFQAFNWAIQGIGENLKAIADAGFTIIQVSPLQQHKEKYNDSWLMSYQPTNFKIGNRLGTREDLKELCEEAAKYNIKIIVDCVLNHTANNGGGDQELVPSVEVEEEIRLRPDFYHKPALQMINDKNRYDCTQFGIGLPDLNTSNHELQNIIINYLRDLQAQGVKGFRFDAAKHIELKDDTWCGSDFWENIMNGIDRKDMFMYGEVLDSEKELVDKYAEFMNVGVNNGKGSDKSKLVQWTFSHDDHRTFNIKRNSDWDIIMNEWEWKLSQNRESHMLFYPTDEMWRTERMKHINLTYQY